MKIKGNKESLLRLTYELNPTVLTLALRLSLRNSNKNNVITFENGFIIRKDRDIAKALNISESMWRKHKRHLINSGVFCKNANTVKPSYLINSYLLGFDTNLTKDTFDTFEEFFKSSINKLEFLKLKSNWYKIDNIICAKKFKDLDNVKISGIYKLYKNNKIIYIGNSKDIRTRILTHNHKGNFDAFDFAILNNESLENSTSEIILEELVFSNKIKVGDSNE